MGTYACPFAGVPGTDAWAERRAREKRPRTSSGAGLAGNRMVSRCTRDKHLRPRQRMGHTGVRKEGRGGTRKAVAKSFHRA